MSSPNKHSEQEEDIAHSQSSLSDKEDQRINFSRKGKGKEHDVPPSTRTSSEHVDEMAYPPVNEDAEETRRVEENLRRWEIAERQRRKAARGSTQSSNPSSLVNDVSRRASLLWSSRKTKHPSIGGSHTALQSQDNVDIVSLTEIAVSPTPSPTRTDSDDPHDLHITDPFANPPEILSPFSDAHQTDSNAPPSNDTGYSVGPDSSLKPTPIFTNSPAPRPPLPKPLNLPPPRTPPPVPIPLSSPLSRGAGPIDYNKTGDDVRWWHDWLCGCGEGPDRGGDHQAGRTNPFE